MEHLFIVIYRYSANEKWLAKSEGVFTDRGIAEGFKKALKYNAPTAWEYEVVEGSTLPAEPEF